MFPESSPGFSDCEGSAAVWPKNELQFIFFLQQINILILVDTRMIYFAVSDFKGESAMQ